MTRQDELAVKGHIELAEKPGYQTKIGNTPRFELRIRTEAAFLVATRVAVRISTFIGSTGQRKRRTGTEASPGGERVAQQRAEDAHLRARGAAVYTQG